MKGYPFLDYPYVFNTSKSFQDASKEILKHPQKAKEKLKELQVRFIHMAKKTNKNMTDLLNKVI